jgi:hypothetical protein
MVEATLNYLAETSERPVYYFYEPPPGTARQNTKLDPRRALIHDARSLAPPPSLDVQGFTLASLRTVVEDLYDVDAIRDVYYREVEQLVRNVSGAARVLAFDHTVRNGTLAAKGERGAQPPRKLVHNDYTETSAPRRVRDLCGAEAETLLRHRFAVVNVWKPIRGPVESMPFAVCDATTIHPHDLVTTELRYPDRTGEVYSVRWNPEHRWFYFSKMQADEVILLKCFDSAPECARFAAHSAFDDPTSPADAPVRESIEVRTLAFFAS